MLMSISHGVLLKMNGYETYDLKLIVLMGG